MDNKWRAPVWAMLLALVLAPAAALAGTTGKIAGRVVDTQGVALPGVNVLIEGTRRGATTDGDGYYLILSVEPGTYTLSASMVGYGKVTKQAVEIQVDYTSTVNFELKEQAIQAAELVVTAERPPVEMDKTSSKYVVTEEDIELTPVVKTTSEYVSLQPGVDQEGTFAVRGSDISYGVDPLISGGSRPRPNDVYVVIDGVRIPQNDGNSAALFTGVNKSAIQQIAVETGVTSAEYGDAQAGTINIVTQDGGQRYHGWTEFTFEPAGKKHWGEDIYDSPLLAPRVKWNDQTWLTETDASGRVIHQRADYTNWHGYTVEGTASGPIGENVSFLASARHSQRAPQYPSATSTGFYNDRGTFINAPNNIQGSASLTFKPTMSTKFKIGTILQRYVAYQGEIVEAGNGGVGEQGRIRGLDVSARNIFLPENFSAAGKYINREELNYASFTHTLSPRTFYEVRLSLSRTKTDTLDVPTFSDLPKTDADGWFYTDRNLATWQLSDRKRWGLKADLSSQVNRNHFVKTGLELTKFDAYYLLWGASDPTNNSMSFYSGGDKPYEVGNPAKPLRAGLYLQDKMEFQGMVVNVGLRMDMQQHTHKEAVRDIFVWAPMWRYYTHKRWLYGEDADRVVAPGPNDYGPVVITGDFVDTPPTQIRFSPRLGVSHPITDRMKMHFSLGRFIQWADLYDLYAKTYSSSGTALSDPSWRDVNGNGQQDPTEKYNNMQNISGGFGGAAWVEPEETLAFEVGWDWNFVTDYVANITMFYRNETNQYGRVLNQWLGPEFSGSGTQSITNQAAGYAKGIELSVRKQMSDNFAFNVSWTSMWSADGLMGLTQGGRQLGPDSTFMFSGEFFYQFQAQPDGSEIPIPLTKAYFTVNNGANRKAQEIATWRGQATGNPYLDVGFIPGFEDKAIYWRVASTGGKDFGPLTTTRASEKVGGRLGQANFQFIVSTPSGVQFGPKFLGWLASDLHANLLYRVRTGPSFQWTAPDGKSLRDRGPMDTIVDLSIDKAFNAAGRVKPSVFVEVRNLFNQQDDADTSDDWMRWGLQLPRPNNTDFLQYGDPDLSYVRAPRQTNLGVRFSF
jgi:outer membrane receptor protein involved in Fe transport